MVDQALFVSELNRFARLLVTDYAISDVLHDLVDSVAAIFGIHGAGVSLVRDGRLAFATASPEEIAALEEVQAAEQAGPSVDAYRTETPILIADIATQRQRWPTLAQVAARTGIVAVGAVPLRIDDLHLGTLDLYDTRAHDWTDEEADVARLLAALAASYIGNSSRLDRAARPASSCSALSTAGSSSNRPRACSPESAASPWTRRSRSSAPTPATATRPCATSPMPSSTSASAPDLCTGRVASEEPPAAPARKQHLPWSG